MHLAPDQEAAILAHLAADHAAEVALLARAFAAPGMLTTDGRPAPEMRAGRTDEHGPRAVEPAATTVDGPTDEPTGSPTEDHRPALDPGIVAEVVGIDQDGLALVVGHDRRPLSVPFPTRLHRVEDLTPRFAALVRAARHSLGLPPGPDPR